MTEAVIVGAGIVGLACAYHLLQDGHRVTILDRDPEGDRASHGNAGGIAVPEIVPASSPGLWARVPGWLIDPLGPLSIRPSHLPKLLPWLHRFLRSGSPHLVEAGARALAALNARTYDDLDPMLDAIGLAGDLHRVGALSVYESEAGLARDQSEWDLRARLGVAFTRISGEQARAAEPALGPRVKCAIVLPTWSHVSDPKRIVAALRDWARSRGAAIVAGEAIEFEAANVVTSQGRRVPFEVCVVATGAWSAALAKRIGDRALIASERGYNATLPAAGVALSRASSSRRRWRRGFASAGPRNSQASTRPRTFDAPRRCWRSRVFICRACVRKAPPLGWASVPLPPTACRSSDARPAGEISCTPAATATSG